MYESGLITALGAYSPGFPTDRSHHCSNGLQELGVAVHFIFISIDSAGELALSPCSFDEDFVTSMISPDHPKRLEVDELW
jgi:hypothetical protein